MKTLFQRLVEIVVMIGVIVLAASIVHQAHLTMASLIGGLTYWNEWLLFFIGYFWFVGFIFTIASALVFVAYYSMYVQYKKFNTYWK